MQQETSITQGQIVKFKWADSATLHGWQVSNHSPVYGDIDSAGIVVENTPQQLTISTSINDENTPICPLGIPWSCIIEVAVIG